MYHQTPSGCISAVCSSARVAWYQALCLSLSLSLSLFLARARSLCSSTRVAWYQALRRARAFVFVC